VQVCPRCPFAMSICFNKEPPDIVHKGNGVRAKCWLYAEDKGGSNI